MSLNKFRQESYNENIILYPKLYVYTGKRRVKKVWLICGPITGQEAPLQENGEVSPEAEFIPRKCDIITIAGRAEKCELAKAALLVGTIFLQ